MKSLLLFCAIFLFSASAFSQKLYFVYLQSDKQQPFFAKVNNETYSSSRSGYLIIPKLIDSTYEIKVGFPRNQFPEQDFVVSISQKDHGFLLKKFGEEGWGLFNLTSSAIQMAGSVQKETVVVRETEPKEQVIEEKLITVQPKAEEKVLPQENRSTEKKEVVSEEAKSIITRKSAKEAEEGVSIVFIDETEMGADTINIVIPNEKGVQFADKSVEKEKKFLPMPGDEKEKKNLIENPFNKTEPKAAVPSVAASKENTENNSNCKGGEATEDDFKKLRKNMAAKTDDDDMVDEARKYFKAKCFSTQQIRNLSVLFLDDLGKYKFFDLAYLFVSDKENFSSLETELEKDYYINRFKAMLQ